MTKLQKFNCWAANRWRWGFRFGCWLWWKRQPVYPAYRYRNGRIHVEAKE